jgi:N-acetylglutamate synthase-like GNAT family acetyltransferase
MNARPILLQPTVEVERLVPILLDALPFDDRLRAELASSHVTAYAATLDGELIGSVAVRWEETSEIVLLGVAKDWRGLGHGTSIVLEIIEEARRRKVRTLLVGTASVSMDNILFYQKCGFRMDHVRRDYFKEQFPEMEPIIWRGITMRDMIVLSFEFEMP